MSVDPAAPLSRREAEDHLRRLVGSPSTGPGRAGIEQEWHTFALEDPTRRLHPDEVLEPIEAGGPLPAGSRTTVEPGGQVEVATTPHAPWWDAIAALRTDGAAVRERLAVAGIACLPGGMDPFRSPGRTLRTPRYAAMEAHFDAVGPAGRRMMGATASVQVNLDHGADEATMQRRWEQAHRLGPALAAAFACSPSRTHRSARLATWAEMDPTRCRSALRDGDPVEDWVGYALDASVMFVREGPECRPAATPCSFAQWIDHGIPQAAGRPRRPRVADLEEHVTTLFPPVRARGWFEVRWLDALPAGLADTAVAALVALLEDPAAGERALRAAAPVDLAWDEAALLGPASPRLAAAGAAVLAIAAEAVDATAAPGHLAEAVADAGERWPGRGRCPADDLQDRLQRGADVVALADPPWEVDRWR